MVVSLMIQALIPTYALDVASNQFVLTISCDDSSIVLTDIDVDIYTSVMAYSDTANGFYQFDEEYAFTVSSDENGVVKFSRPTTYFSFTIDLESLPSGFGVSEQTVFVDQSKNSHVIELKKIENIDVVYENDSAVPVLSSNDGKSLYASAGIYEPSLQNGNFTTDIENNKISYKQAVDVVLGTETYTIEKDYSYNYKDEVDKAAYLHNKGLITEHEYILTLSNYILGNIEISNEDEMDGTDLYWKIRNYYEENSSGSSSARSISMSKIKEALDSFVPNASTKTRSSETSATSPSGRFKVFYDSTDTNISKEVAEAVATVFDEVDALFYSSCGFLRPYYDSSTSYYKVYLVDTNAYAGSTPLVGTDGSYINISYTTAKNIYNSTGIYGYPDAYRGVVAHEYMHAIFYRYGILYNTSDRQWMHESFASWAGMAFEPDYAAYGTSRIKNFLGSTWKSLTYFTDGGDYDLRHYGSCLFPLYIQQEMGGYTTIKKILQSYSSSNDPLTAINVGLAYYDYSLAEAYTGCATYNFDTGYFYPLSPTTTSKAWGQGDVNSYTTYPQSSSVTHGVSALACHYTNFIAPTDSTSTLTITVDYSNISSGSNAVLKVIRTTASGDYYISSGTITSNRCTIIQYNFGYHIATAIAIVPINTGLTGTTSYTRTATLS